jgi:cold shock CspA family protein
VSEEELAAAAAVLEAGAKPSQLAAFRVRQKGRSDLEAFTDWADLLTRGVPRDDASSAITKLWQDGADDATFHNLWRSVQTDILQGLNPGTALQNRVRETPGGPAARKITPPEGQQENQSSR